MFLGLCGWCCCTGASVGDTCVRRGAGGRGGVRGMGEEEKWCGRCREGLVKP